MNSINNLNNRVSFFVKDNSGPEAHGGGYEKIYECACSEHSLNLKDVTAINLQSGNHSVTIMIRNEPRAYRPEYNHYFHLESGYFQRIKFNVKSISVEKGNMLKIVGESE